VSSHKWRRAKNSADIITHGTVWGTVVFALASTVDSALSNPHYLGISLAVGFAWIGVVEYIDRKHEEEDRRERES